MPHLTQVTKLVQRQFIHNKARRRNKRKDKKKKEVNIYTIFMGNKEIKKKIEVAFHFRFAFAFCLP
jgi:hypothetical protein